MFLKLSTALLVLMLAFVPAASQNYSTESARAVKFFEEALSQYRMYNYKAAEQKARQAIDKAPEFTEAYLLLSDIYETRKNYPKQSEVLKTVLKHKPDKRQMILLKLIEVEMKTGHYHSADEYIRQMEKMNLSDFYSNNLSTFKKAKDFALQAMQNPVDFEPYNCGKLINSPHDDYFPALTADGLFLYKTVNLPTGKHDTQGNEFFQEDIFVSRRKEDGTPIKTEPLPETINTPGNEGAFTVSQDGKTIFFTVCSRSRGTSYHGSVEGSCDIFIAERLSGGKYRIINPGRPLNSPEWDSQPSFSSDGKTLYFVSSRKGGYGKSDIWVSTKKEDGSLSQPENLGEPVNTDGNEQTPFIHADGKTLYFSSDGHPGMGSMDIFLSKKDKNGHWSKPKNLGYPINTHKEEIGLVVNAAGDSAFFSAEYDDSRGGLDIYRFALGKPNRPEKTAFITGRVYDIKTNQSIQATIELINTDTGKLRAVNEADYLGKYLICINAGNNFAFHVSKTGYMFYSDRFSLEDTRRPDDKYLKNIPLTPIEKGKRVILKNVFFAVDSYSLRPESYPELNRLVGFMSENPKISVEISGHTDNTGSRDHNQTLSHQRAKAVYNYLIKKGIDKDRLQFKGYGSMRPVAENDSPENRQKNRRTECEIIKK